MTSRRTCDQLGLCQHRKPACGGCAWRLAPGTVEGPFKRKRSSWLARNWRYLLIVVAVLAQPFLLMAAAGSLGFLLGYLGVFRG